MAVYRYYLAMEGILSSVSLSSWWVLPRPPSVGPVNTYSQRETRRVCMCLRACICECVRVWVLVSVRVCACVSIDTTCVYF
jgi:hypothetical protein